MLSRFDNDTYKGNKEELSLVDLVGEQVETVKVIDDSKKVEFENNLEDGGMIISDRKLLIRIIQNLLSNAIKYANSKVKIVAHTVRDDENVAHTVRDDENVGVSEDVGANYVSPIIQYQSLTMAMALTAKTLTTFLQDTIKAKMAISV